MMVHPSPSPTEPIRAGVLPDTGVVRPRSLTFDGIYRAWFGEVSRWSRALGGPSADVEDLAQEVFLVVRRKLADFDGTNLAGWLYRITKNTVSDARRRSWFIHLVKGRGSLEESIPQSKDDPAVALETLEERRMLFTLLEKMGRTTRETFILFEILGYNGEEIASLEGIPLNTVWTRLHKSRKRFLELVAQMSADATTPRNLKKGRQP